MEAATHQHRADAQLKQSPLEYVATAGRHNEEKLAGRLGWASTLRRGRRHVFRRSRAGVPGACEQEQGVLQLVLTPMHSHKSVMWKPEEDAVLRELAAKGKTALQVALRLRRSQSGVKRRASQLGIRLTGKRTRLPAQERTFL